MSVRVYTLLTPGQKLEIEALSERKDRSVSYLIARAIDDHIGDVGTTDKTKAVATKKVFTRTTVSAAVDVKERARLLECHDWQVVNSCVERYLKCAS
jgi:hypothetical protein